MDTEQDRDGRQQHVWVRIDAFEPGSAHRVTTNVFDRPAEELAEALKEATERALAEGPYLVSLHVHVGKSAITPETLNPGEIELTGRTSSFSDAAAELRAHLHTKEHPTVVADDENKNEGKTSEKSA